MKKILFILTFCISFSTFASTDKTPSFLEQIKCDGHNLSTINGGSRASKYTIELNPAEHAIVTERKISLYERSGDIDYKTEEDYGCTRDADLLTCEVGETKVQLDMGAAPLRRHASGKYIFFKYKATMWVPQLYFLTKKHEALCYIAVEI